MPRVRVELLGPVRAWREGAEVAVGAPRQQAVLAALALSPGRQVSLDTLVEAVWGDEAPASAVGSVRTYVFRLRQGLGRSADGESAITTAGAGYVLRPDRTELDVDTFRDRVAAARDARRQGDDQRAMALFEESLGLWSGVPLAGVPGPYARSQRERLEELRTAVLEERLEVAIGLGGHAMAVAELQALLTAYPLREKLCELLMLALYRSGRQADAFSLYGEMRRRLADQLGVDPGPGLRDMQLRLLRGDSGLTSAQAPPRAPVVRPAQLPAGPAVFAGRHVELAGLDAELDAERRAGVMVVSGMAGVGKTALALHWAHRVAHRFPDGQLYADLRGYDPADAASVEQETLRGFLETLGVPSALVPASPEAQVGLYRSMVHDRSLLVVLDNARDARQVHRLLPASAGSMTLITSRDELTALIAVYGAQSVTLEAFSPAEAHENLAIRLGQARVAAEPEAVAEIVDLCGGLPLASAIVAARATARRGLSLSAIAGELRDARTRLDGLRTGDAATDVRAAFSWSYHQVSEPAARLFRLLSVHPGPEFSVEAAASLAGLPVAASRALLDDLSAGRLVAERQPGRFAFHDLIRVYAGELSAELDGTQERSAALRRLLDHYLHTAHTAAAYFHTQVPVPRPDAACAGVIPEWVPDFQRAVAWISAERPVLKAAIAAARDTIDARPYAWRLALQLDQFCRLHGHWHDWAEMMEAAVSAAVSAHDRLGEAHARRSLADASRHLGDNERAMAELELADDLFTRAGDAFGKANLDLSVAALLTSQGHYEKAIRRCDRAGAHFLAVGYRAGQARCLEQLGECLARQGEFAKSVEAFDSALRLYRELGDRCGEAVGWYSISETYRLAADYGQAIERLLHSARMFDELGSRRGLSEVLARLGECRLSSDDIPGALADWRQALAIADDLRLPLADSLRARIAATLAADPSVPCDTRQARRLPANDGSGEVLAHAADPPRRAEMLRRAEERM